MKKFTLIEMLVVIAIISILASMMLPSVRTAIRNASGMTCVNNLRQGGMVVNNYAMDNNGWTPVGANFYMCLADGGYAPNSQPGTDTPSGAQFFCPLTYEKMVSENSRCWFESVRWKTTYKPNYYAHRSDRKVTAWLIPHTSLDKVVGIKISAVRNPSKLFHIADAYAEPKFGNLLFDSFGGSNVASSANSQYQWTGIWHNQMRTGTLYFDLHVSEIEMPLRTRQWFVKNIDEFPWIEK